MHTRNNSLTKKKCISNLFEIFPFRIAWPICQINSDEVICDKVDSRQYDVTDGTMISFTLCGLI